MGVYYWATKWLFNYEGWIRDWESWTEKWNQDYQGQASDQHLATHDSLSNIYQSLCFLEAILEFWWKMLKSSFIITNYMRYDMKHLWIVENEFICSFEQSQAGQFVLKCVFLFLLTYLSTLGGMPSKKSNWHSCCCPIWFSTNVSHPGGPQF